METNENEVLTDSTTSEQEVVDTQETDVVEEVQETEQETEQEEVKTQVETPEAKLARLERQAKQLKKKLGIKDEVKTEVKQDTSLSIKDTLALMEAKVSSEDIDDVTDYAKFKGISVAEALKSSTVKSILAEKQEFRKTAQASNVGTVKRANSKVADDVLLANASKGKLPESDDELERLIMLRKGYKK